MVSSLWSRVLFCPLHFHLLGIETLLHSINLELGSCSLVRYFLGAIQDLRGIRCTSPAIYQLLNKNGTYILLHIDHMLDQGWATFL